MLAQPTSLAKPGQAHGPWLNASQGLSLQLWLWGGGLVIAVHAGLLWGLRSEPAAMGDPSPAEMAVPVAVWMPAARTVSPSPQQASSGTTPSTVKKSAEAASPAVPKPAREAPKPSPKMSAGVPQVKPAHSRSPKSNVARPAPTPVAQNATEPPAPQLSQPALEPPVRVQSASSKPVAEQALPSGVGHRVELASAFLKDRPDSAVGRAPSDGSGHAAAGALVSGASTATAPSSKVLARAAQSAGSGKTVVQADAQAFRLHNPKPVYPLSSRRLGEQGLVQVKVSMTERGEVEAAVVVKSSGHSRLDASALRAVRQWRYELQAGQRLKSQALVVDIEFNLSDPS